MVSAVLLALILVVLTQIFRQLKVIAHNQGQQVKQAYILSRKEDTNA